jgi:hypothetical protein
MKRFFASLLCVLLLAPGCVTSRTPRVQSTPQGSARSADRDVLAGFAAHLQIGSGVKATVTGNRTIRGTLLKRTDQSLVIQPRARIAEPLVEVPFDDLLALEQETPSSRGTVRAVALGVGVGVSAAIATLYVLAALLGGD